MKLSVTVAPCVSNPSHLHVTGTDRQTDRKRQTDRDRYEERAKACVLAWLSTCLFGLVSICFVSRPLTPTHSAETRIPQDQNGAYGVQRVAVTTVPPTPQLWGPLWEEDEKEGRGVAGVGRQAGFPGSAAICNGCMTAGFRPRLAQVHFITCLAAASGRAVGAGGMLSHSRHHRGDNLALVPFICTLRLASLSPRPHRHPRPLGSLLHRHCGGFGGTASALHSEGAAFEPRFSPSCNTSDLTLSCWFSLLG